MPDSNEVTQVERILNLVSQIKTNTEPGGVGDIACPSCGKTALYERSHHNGHVSIQCPHCKLSARE